jgi:hypothetical protein
MPMSQKSFRLISADIGVAKKRSKRNRKLTYQGFALEGGRSCRDGLAEAWRPRTLQPHRKGTRITGTPGGPQKLLFVAIPRRERRYDFRIARTKRSAIIMLIGG